MDLNEVIEIQVEDKDFPRKNEFCLMGAPTRKQFPNNIDLSSQMTKPEDQGSHGTCMAFSGTTFVESLLWRLTGEKDEFTADELYNIYFDAYGKCKGLTIDANERKTLRGPEGKWDADWKYGGISYYVLPEYEIDLTDDSEYYSEVSIYCAMINYNNPENRKNHYPDKFSILCQKVKTYLSHKIFSKCGDEDDVFKYIHVNGNVYSAYEPHPNVIKEKLLQSRMPLKASMPAATGSHAVVLYGQDDHKIYLNSSWDSRKTCTMTFDYRYTTEGLSTSHYLYNFQCPGYFSSKYLGISNLDFYKETNVEKHTITVFPAPFFGGKVLGVQSGTKVDHGSKMTLIAVPDEGHYFKCWEDQFDTGQYCSNIRTFEVTSDLSITPWFTDNEDDVYRVKQDMCILSCQSCDIKCTSFTGEVIESDMPSIFNVPLSGNISFKYGSHAKIEVFPKSGYSFKCWNDGNENNPRDVHLTSDIFLYPLMSS